MAGNTPIEGYANSMLVQCKRIMHELYVRFPNAHLSYVASRIYGGYASGTLNPEPYAYRSGWTMKQLIYKVFDADAAGTFSNRLGNCASTPAPLPR